MAHLHTKHKKGRPYYYIREMARIDGKPKVTNQIYLGTAEKIMKVFTEESKPDKIQTQEFGALWVANEVDKKYDFASIVDGVIPRSQKEEGPSVGDYFVYAIFNRMVDSTSKRALCDWYNKTAIQIIRPTTISDLSSERYWEKWNRVDSKHITKIGELFFKKVWEIEKPESDCFLFDTTNYYTFMATHTKSDLAKRGKNKDGKSHLRQVGLALLVGRGSRLPLYYHVYEGSTHDSKLFAQIMDEMFGVIHGFGDTKQRLTVVFDKGMNSDDNFKVIDGNTQIHFITSYSPYFAEEYARENISKFEPLGINKNVILEGDDQGKDKMLAYRTKGDFWGKSRTVVVTYNPKTYRKQSYTFEKKLCEIREALLEMRTHVKNKDSQWRNKKAIEERYVRLCQRYHVATNYYQLEFDYENGDLNLSFRKDLYEVEKKTETLGKNIIITDNADWTTDDIVQGYLDRYEVEEDFRLSKDDDLVTVYPMRHWTDSKIRCHLLSCVVALTYLRIIERKLLAAGNKMSAKFTMKEMQSLDSCLVWNKDARKPERMLETPTKTQAEVLKAFGHQIGQGGVLHPIK
ncbi:MAG: IS1634 family transposase [Deltaproteobacteria bacterium]|nr:IS1634 family transposase [Deltaproteobacteria bacterium]